MLIQIHPVINVTHFSVFPPRLFYFNCQTEKNNNAAGQCCSNRLYECWCYVCGRCTKCQLDRFIPGIKKKQKRFCCGIFIVAEDDFYVEGVTHVNVSSSTPLLVSFISRASVSHDSATQYPDPILKLYLEFIRKHFIGPLTWKQHFLLFLRVGYIIVSPLIKHS